MDLQVVNLQRCRHGLWFSHVSEFMHLAYVVKVWIPARGCAVYFIVQYLGRVYLLFAQDACLFDC